MLVRPQDWVPGFYGFPTAIAVIPLGLLFGYLEYKKDPDSFKTPQNVILIFYLLIIFNSTAYNIDLSEGFTQFVDFLKRVLLFYMVIWIVRDEKQLRSALNVWLAFTLFIAYQVTLQAYDGQSWGGLTVYPGYEEIRVRWYGLWDGPNVLGILFIMAACIAFERLFSQPSIISKVLNLAYLMAFLHGIFLTNSRGAVLAMGVAVLFGFRKYFLNPKVLVVGVIAAVIVIGALPSRLTEVNSQEESAHERTWLWESGLRMARLQPIVGVGRNQFSSNNSLKLVAHNNYVQDLGELGYPGLFILMSLLWFTAKGNYIASNSKYTISKEMVMNNRMMNLILIGYCAVTFFVLMEHDLFFFFLGMCAASYLIARRQDNTIPALSYTKIDLLIIIASMVVVYTMIWLAAIKEII